MTADLSKPGVTPVSDAAFAEASRWHARLREPDADAQTHAAFQDWLASDPAHFDAYDQADRLWAALGQPPGGQRDEAAIEALIDSTRPHRKLARGLFAGLLLCLAVAGADWMRRGGLDDLRADYIAPVGERRTVALADGSVVELNTDTAMAVDLHAGRRSVRLFRGEAFFQVEHDENRPFVVETREGEIRVTGTSFNVRVDGDVTEVGLLKGAVRLAAAAHPDAPLILAPGEESDITSQVVGPARPFEAEAATAWRRGQLVFFRTPLAKVIEELNRYQRGRIVIWGADLRARPVTGVFDTRDPSAAIDMIERTLGVSSTRLTDALIIVR